MADGVDRREDGAVYDRDSNEYDCEEAITESTDRALKLLLQNPPGSPKRGVDLQSSNLRRLLMSLIFVMTMCWNSKISSPSNESKVLLRPFEQKNIKFSDTLEIHFQK